MIMLNIKPLFIMAFVSLIFMMNLLLITEVHYTADIIGGIVFSVWFYRTAIRITLYADKLLSLPYFIVKWIYDNKCKEEEVE